MRITLASIVIASAVCLASFTVWSAWGDEIISGNAAKKNVANESPYKKSPLPNPELVRVNKLYDKLLGKPDDKTTQLLKAKKLLGNLENKLISIDYIDGPLSDVLVHLAENATDNVLINQESLEEEGIDLNERITLKLKNVTVHTALSIVLDKFDLAYLADEETGIIHIHTESTDDLKAYTKTYNCQDILFPPNGITIKNKTDKKTELHADVAPQSPRTIDADHYFNKSQELMLLIQGNVGGDWLDDGGEAGVIHELDGIIVIKQTQSAHRAIEKLLAQLRTARKSGQKVWINYQLKEPKTYGFGTGGKPGGCGMKQPPQGGSGPKKNRTGGAGVGYF